MANFHHENDDDLDTIELSRREARGEVGERLTGAARRLLRKVKRAAATATATADKPFKISNPSSERASERRANQRAC